MGGTDIENLQTDLDCSGDWAVGNEIKINPCKSKAFSFTRARVKVLLNYSFGDQNIPEANSFKYLQFNIYRDLSWASQVNFTVQKAWKALHFIMHIFRKENSNMKSLAYTSLLRLILQYGALCWDLYREGQIIALDWLQKKAAKFANHMNELFWLTLGQRR